LQIKPIILVKGVPDGEITEVDLIRVVTIKASRNLEPPMDTKNRTTMDIEVCVNLEVVYYVSF
jgi:hypothetical protein